MGKGLKSFHRVAMGVSYFGPDFSGFQVQQQGSAVANALETALFKITGQSIAIVCAGRTDSGVHAHEQVIHADVPISIDLRAWTFGMNRLLPRSVRILWAQVMPSEFHARFSAVARQYQYLIYQQNFLPVHLHNRVHHSYRSIDIDLMNQASQMLLGVHDFTAFQASGCQAHHAKRHLQILHWQQNGPWIIVTVKANAFLYRMVRNLVGALLRVAYGQSSHDFPYQLLISNTRPGQMPTAPAYGLYLDCIDYPDYNIPKQSAWYDSLLRE
ncbi:tRNA pseudouridine(38-40) synthase TruA [Gammaproteobacteria bacterium]|nr:tRNA pseudouridine(38-40) synthase TruA [Gammaproteobacteria bacterium]